MPGPLLVVDAPSMLFRAFYALPDSITGKDGRPVNALLGTANLILREVEEHSPRAVVLCFGPDAADYRLELFDGYHAERPEVPDDALAPVRRLARLLRRLRLDRGRERRPRGGRPARLLRQPRGGRGRQRARDDRRPRHVPVRHRPRHDPLRAHRRPRRRGDRSRGGEAALRRPARARSRLHRPARRPLRRHPRGEGHRREGSGGPAEAPRLARDRAGGRPARDEAARAHGPHLAARRAAPLQGDRDPARRRRELPRDRELDRAGAAAAARERGMDRLAARLEGGD